jgi:hypothetical protein
MKFHMKLPLELVDLCLLCIQDPVPRFRIVVALRRTFVRDKTLPLLPSASVDEASRRGLVDLLQCWRESGLEMQWSSRVMDIASWLGHIAVLEWWKTSGLEMKWSSRAMNLASSQGRVDVLQWWKQSGLEMKWRVDRFRHP